MPEPETDTEELVVGELRYRLGHTDDHEFVSVEFAEAQKEFAIRRTDAIRFAEQLLTHAAPTPEDASGLIGIMMLKAYLSNILTSLEAGRVDGVIELLRAQRDALDILEEVAGD